MINEEEKPTGFMGWLKESVTVKLVFIGLLILVLLIPSSMVSNLIDERAERQQDVVKDISYNFAGSQVIKGPVLVIPYKVNVREADQSGKAVYKEETDNLYIMPDNRHCSSAALGHKLLKLEIEAIVTSFFTRLSPAVCKILMPPPMLCPIR